MFFLFLCGPFHPAPLTEPPFFTHIHRSQFGFSDPCFPPLRSQVSVDKDYLSTPTSCPDANRSYGATNSRRAWQANRGSPHIIGFRKSIQACENPHVAAKPCLIRPWTLHSELTTLHRNGPYSRRFYTFPTFIFALPIAPKLANWAICPLGIPWSLRFGNSSFPPAERLFHPRKSCVSTKSSFTPRAFTSTCFTTKTGRSKDRQLGFAAVDRSGALRELSPL